MAVALLLIGCSATASRSDDVDEADLETAAPSSLSERPAATSACNARTECTTTKHIASHRSCVFAVGFDGSGVYSETVGSSIGVLYGTTSGPAAGSGPRGLRAEVVDATTTRAYIEGVPGLPFGASAERVDRGRSAICQHLAKRPVACDIVLFGYSRGAFIANQLAWVMHDHGCADGSHKGEPIKFLGAFDPVSTQMGTEWGDEHWQGSVPPNVESVLQVYKDPRKDPRGGIEGLTLTSTLLDTSAVASSCAKPFTRAEHPSGADWHHGEIGHFELPREAMKCALEKAGVTLTRP